MNPAGGEHIDIDLFKQMLEWLRLESDTQNGLVSGKFKENLLSRMQDLGLIEDVDQL